MKNRHTVLAALVAGMLALLVQSEPGAAGELGANDVVVSIKPIHSLVALVMDGVGVPELIVEGAASPHSFSPKPSQAAKLQLAKTIFWIGAGLESALAALITTLGGPAQVVALAQTDGLKLLPSAGGRAPASAGHGDGNAAVSGLDTHVWLDPDNARIMVTAIADVLAKSDPDHASQYQDNARATVARLDELGDEIARLLEPVKGRPFVVFHDAFRYFEARFGVPAAGAILANPDGIPGARRIADIRRTIVDLGAICVFSEPQFQSGLVDVLVEGTGAATGVLDPLGSAIASGPDHYFVLMRTMAQAFSDCLSAAG